MGCSHIVQEKDECWVNTTLKLFSDLLIGGYGQKEIAAQRQYSARAEPYLKLPGVQALTKVHLVVALAIDQLSAPRFSIHQEVIQ